MQTEADLQSVKQLKDQMEAEYTSNIASQCSGEGYIYSHAPQESCLFTALSVI